MGGWWYVLLSIPNFHQSSTPNHSQTLSFPRFVLFPQTSFKVHSKFTQSSLTVAQSSFTAHPTFSHSPLKVHSQFPQSPLKVHLQFSQSSFKVHPKFTLSSLEVHSRFIVFLFRNSSVKFNQPYMFVHYLKPVLYISEVKLVIRCLYLFIYLSVWLK